MTIGYHSGDLYQNASATARFSYYGVTGTPTVKLDGDFAVVGGTTYGTMYPIYQRYFNQHKSVPSPFDIDLECSYDSTSRQGRLDIKVKNTTSSAVSGQLQVALCENHLYYVWYSLDSVHHVERAMLPSASGEAITVPANDSIVKSREFTMDPAWVARNCEMVVFVQNNSSKAMYQGARIGVYQVPALVYRGYEEAFPRPGGDANLTVGLRNIGSGDASDVSAVLSTTDPYVSVTSGSANFGSIAIGADVYSQAPFAIRAAGNCPDGHVATMNLAITAANGYATVTSFPMHVTNNVGFLDDIEQGENGWTHSGTRDNWHQTTHRSQSPSHAWYCGNEGAWRYSDQTDMRLVSPWFTVGDSATLQFDHWFATEVDYDYVYVDVNNGSPFWWTMAIFNGSSGSWQHQTYPLDQFAGQTLRCRWRFLSDYNTNDEGWYVDNVSVTPYSTAVAEPGPLPRGAKVAARTMVTDQVELTYSVPAGRTADLAIYDAGGRLVACPGTKLSGVGTTTWNPGQDTRAGTYFVRLDGAGTVSVEKFVIAR